MARNWAELGIAWDSVDVAKRHGPNASDQRVIGKVEAPKVTDIDAFIQAVGKDKALAHYNHASSFYVRARAWYKGRAKADFQTLRKMEPEAMREAVWNAVCMNVRSGRGVIVRQEKILAAGDVRIVLAAGTAVDYADLFGQLLAGWIDQGIPQDVARNVVAKTLATAGIEPPDEDEEEETDE